MEELFNKNLHDTRTRDTGSTSKTSKKLWTQLKIIITCKLDESINIIFKKQTNNLITCEFDACVWSFFYYYFN